MDGMALPLRQQPGILASAQARRQRVQDRLAAGWKFCPQCRRWLTLGDFWPSPAAYDGVRGYCRQCEVDRNRDRRRRKREERQRREEQQRQQAEAETRRMQALLAAARYRPAASSVSAEGCPLCSGHADGGRIAHDAGCPLRFRSLRPGPMLARRPGR